MDSQLLTELARLAPPEHLPMDPSRPCNRTVVLHTCGHVFRGPWNCEQVHGPVSHRHPVTTHAMYYKALCPNCKVGEIEDALRDSSLQASEFQRRPSCDPEMDTWWGAMVKVEMKRSKAESELPGARELRDKNERSGWKWDREMALEAWEGVKWLPGGGLDEGSRVVKWHEGDDWKWRFKVAGEAVMKIPPWKLHRRSWEL